MTLLSCSAMTCFYNKDSYCSKGDIKVEGNQAQEACETCCSSFRECTEGCGKNSTSKGAERIQIDCSAEHCQYNENRNCVAGKVDISGTSAHSSDQTECSTFEKQK